MTKVHVDELPPDVKRQLGIKTRQQQFSKESVLSWSLKTLALLADLTQDQRRRVLEHAAKVNKM